MNTTKRKYPRFLPGIILLLTVLISCISPDRADYVILNAKVITMDLHSDISEGIAVKGDRIVAVDRERKIRKYIRKGTKVIDAGGRAVVPGLIEGHLHPLQAALSELEEEIPDVHSIDELLVWVRSEALTKADGEWIIFPKFFYTRLRDLRPPTLDELDAAAPRNPVFLNGSYGGVINTAAMKVSGIDAGMDNSGVMRDKKTGKPNGLIKRHAFSLLKLPPPKKYTIEQRKEALAAMMQRYNAYGITSVTEGAGNYDIYRLYREMLNEGMLTTRVFVNILLTRDPGEPVDAPVRKIKTMDYKTGDGDEWVRIGALKVILDGGILTGTAYLREPWGEKAANIYGIPAEGYRGILNYSYADLVPLVKTAAENGWKFTAHCTGGGGVDLLLNAYEEVNKTIPLEDRRFSIIHGNFFTPASISRMHRLGVYADMQAAWFYKDAAAMKLILGDDRIKTFMPYRSLLDSGVVVNGGSDHMVKFDAVESVNPYNPFLAMWSMITRKTEGGAVIMPEEAVTREEALRMYTVSNAYASFEENIKGSLEPGKLADLVILSDDILTCPTDRIRGIRSELTMTGGSIVYSTGSH